MRHFRSRPILSSLAMAVALPLAGCDQATAPTAISPSTAFNFVNGPDTPGPIIVRVEGQPVFFFAADEKNNLLSIHFPLDFVLCGGSTPRNLADAEFIVTPSERVVALLQDEDGAVAVYGTADFTEAFGPGGPLSDIPHLCAFMTGDKLLASGLARRVSAFTTGAFSASWTGTLTDTDGNPVNYAEHHAFIVDPLTGARTIVNSLIQLH